MATNAALAAIGKSVLAVAMPGACAGYLAGYYLAPAIDKRVPSVPTPAGEVRPAMVVGVLSLAAAAATSRSGTMLRRTANGGALSGLAVGCVLRSAALALAGDGPARVGDDPARGGEGNGGEAPAPGGEHAASGSSAGDLTATSGEFDRTVSEFATESHVDNTAGGTVLAVVSEGPPRGGYVGSVVDTITDAGALERVAGESVGGSDASTGVAKSSEEVQVRKGSGPVYWVSEGLFWVSYGLVGFITLGAVNSSLLRLVMEKLSQRHGRAAAGKATGEASKGSSGTGGGDKPGV